MEGSQSLRECVYHADPLPTAFQRLLQFLTPPGKGCLERFGIIFRLCEERYLLVHGLQAVAQSRQRGFICSGVLNQCTSRRLTCKVSCSATLTAEFPELVVSCCARIDEIVDVYLFLLTQSPGASRGLVEHEEVHRHLEPDDGIDPALQIKAFVDTPVRNNHHMTT